MNPPALPDNLAAINRAAAIETSLKAFAWGIPGAIPFLGVIPAIRALTLWARIAARWGREWNPAETYLKWGVTCALFGLSLTALTLLGIAMNAASGSF